MTTNIKKEFEAAFEEHIGLPFGYDKTPASKAFSVGALWAATWAFERCAELYSGFPKATFESDDVASSIRQLAKDLVKP